MITSIILMHPHQNFIGNEREHRLVHQMTGPDFQNQQQGMPSYQQLLYINASLSRQLQALQRQNMTEDVAGNMWRSTANTAFLRQQNFWNQMGGQNPSNRMGWQTALGAWSPNLQQSAI